ncbi:MAG: Mov34/MPN/PAD-1 family protein [Candidatus Odinarchaeota archaeon]
MNKYPPSSFEVVNDIPRLLNRFIKTVQSAGNGKEACALIFGFKESETVFRMTDYCQTENVLRSPTSFLIDPEELVTTLVRFEDEMAKELVAIFHSHPGQSNTPSTSDFKFMKYWRIPWFISKANPRGSDDIRAFILEDENKIKEIAINEILATSD